MNNRISVLSTLFLPFCILTLNCNPSPFLAAENDVNVIVDKVLEAYGGSALESVHSFKMEGRASGLWCHGDSDPYPLTRVYVQPGDTRVDYHCQGEAKPFAFFIDVNHAGSKENYYGSIAGGEHDGWYSIKKTVFLKQQHSVHYGFLIDTGNKSLYGT